MSAMRPSWWSMRASSEVGAEAIVVVDAGARGGGVDLGYGNTAAWLRRHARWQPDAIDAFRARR
jgi:hypothetical protein